MRFSLVCTALGAAAALSQPARAEAPAARPVSLREALALAAKQGPDVTAARAQAKVAAAGVDKTYNAWKPDLTATGTFDHTSAPATFDPNPLIAALAPPGVTPPVQPVTTILAANSWYGTLQLTQPLFTPQGWFLTGPAKDAAQAAALGSDDAREQVLLNVARTYHGLKGLEGLIAAARDAEKVALKREADAKAQINAGTAVEIALLRAQTETASARAQIASLEGQRDAYLAGLEGLVGEAITANGNAPMDPDFGQAADEQQSPWEQTPAVQSALAQVRAAAGSVDYDKWQWLPSVSGIAKGNYNSNGGFAGKNTSYDLILTATIPLYDHGQRYTAKHEDEAKLAQAQAALAQSRARGRSSWLSARASLAASQAVLEQSVAQAALAARTQQQVETSAKAGVATSLDLSDADNKRFAADSAAAQARAAVDIRRAEVAAAEGRLSRSLER
jgi:outer membrane protein TolC